MSYPNGQSAQWHYADILGDLKLLRITHQYGSTPISEFIYGRDVPRGLVATWSQQSGTNNASIYRFGYDVADQITSAIVTQGTTMVEAFAYNYDLAGNRLLQRINGTTNTASYNALNQLTTTVGGMGNVVTNEWDAEQRIRAVNSGDHRTAIGERLRGF